MSLEWDDVVTPLPFDPRGYENMAQGQIKQIYADGTVDLYYKGGTANRVRVLAAYTPRTGELVEVMRRNGATLVVLGPSRTSNVTTVEVSSSLGVMYNVEPALVPSGSLANPLVIPAIGTASYRGGWERPEVYQGAYDTRWGYWRGCYFYGSAPQQLAGRTVTSATIRISRENAGGVITNVPQWLAPHIHETQPGSSPVFVDAARSIGVATRNTPVELNVPVDWAQALVEGRCKGFGHLLNSTSNYSIAKSLAEDPLTGRLTIYWS